MPATGRAAVFVAPRKPFAIREYPLPQLEPGAILVKITRAIICGSDLHFWRGDLAKWGFDGSRETILGHEMTGRVFALGPGVKTDSLGQPLKEGDRVVFQYFQPCRSCHVCLTGQTRACLSPNRWISLRAKVGEWPYFIGGYADYYYLTPGRAVFKVTDERIPEHVLASINCAFCQVAQGLESMGLTLGESLVIQGSGGLGLYATVLAKERGAVPIIVIDALNSRLALAKEFGADFTININDLKTSAERVAKVKELTKGLGADVAAELVGFPQVVPEGLEMLRPGGRYLDIGNISRGVTFDCDPSLLVMGSKSIVGVMHYEPRFIPQVLDFLSRNLTRYPFHKLVSHTFPLEKIDLAFQQAEWAGKDPTEVSVIRAAIVPEIS